MQLVTLTLRLGGSLSHTVVKENATPAEILILRSIHGSDAVVDIRPTSIDKKITVEDDWNRLANAYDKPGTLMSAPGDEPDGSIMAKLFPGAMRKLPTSLKDIGEGHLEAPASIRSARRGEGAKAPNADGDKDINPPEPVEDDDKSNDEEVSEDAPTGGLSFATPPEAEA